MAGRYYFEYEGNSGKFPHQRVLNEAITNSNCMIQSDESNAMTIRLLVANESLINLVREVDNANKKQASFHTMVTNLNLKPDHGLKLVTFNFTEIQTSGSGISNRESFFVDTQRQWENLILPEGLYYKDYSIHSKNDSTFRPIIAHKFLYEFFSNYGSILDRFAHELNQLFVLGIDENQIDWGNILKQQITLDKKCNGLFQRILNFNNNTAKRTMRYRNRFLHDGLIPIQISVDKNDNGWHIYILDDPDDSLSALNTDALYFCIDCFGELLIFLDDCYLTIYTMIKLTGLQPPW